ncbi:hypothetical protein ACLESO_24105 [Pyxidicoccus sp. 3LG]
MLESPQFRQQRLTQVFLERGGAGEATKPFGEFPEAVRELLVREAGLGGGELPILACYFDLDAWTLVTSARIFHRRAGTTRQWAWGELQSVTTNLRTAAARYGIRSKRELRHLWLQTAKGTCELEVEPGPPLFGFLNALQSVAEP